MSAAWLKLITILCLFSTALSDPESGGVVWRDVGGSVTIQCRNTASAQERLSLEKGLSQDEILNKDRDSKKITIAKAFRDRLQLDGEFPSLNIFIRNLTTDDMGPYWCVYKKYDNASRQIKTEKGKGSVLLVVRDQERMAVIGDASEKTKQCEPSDKNLVLLSVVISAAILLGIIIGFLIWIVLKTKASRSTRSTVKPRNPTNDVYEDMRGTRRLLKMSTCKPRT
ncbi:hypothetical protein D9C73_025933 [Collichthys lucidus]|uniref:Immunoglobulin V-set domain-containing protein n=1 Tax=Collichthys lucidus TaxID=240159 RepID=A0A4U5VT35_COLLU|nr:hypothetical protein D9C73_025933 [Collichthys lucidus]